MHFSRRSFSFPQELSQALECFFLKEKGKIGQSLQSLWPLLARERGQGKDAHYSFDSRFANAYAAYYLPANLMKMPLVLEEMRILGLPILESGMRWLDIGSGPGTALWGLAWWCKRYSISFDYLALEQSKQFIKLGEQLIQKLHEISPNVRPSFQLFQEKTGRHTQLSEKILNYNPDFLCFMNSIGELYPDPAERVALIQKSLEDLSVLAKRQKRIKWFILIEPGTKDASRELLELRQQLLANGDIRIWLPCLDNRACGALIQEKDWCHEEAECVFPDWMQKLGSGAGLRKEALVFSYLICSVGIHPQEPMNWPKQGLRMVSQRLEQKGQTECYLCTKNGKQRVRVQHSKKTEHNENFFTSVRGNLFTAVEHSEKGDIIHYTEASHDKMLDPELFPPV